MEDPTLTPGRPFPGMTLVQRGQCRSRAGRAGDLRPGRARPGPRLVTGAGFDEPELEEIAFDFRYADFDDLWDALIRLAGPLARVIKALPDDERQATREAIMENVRLPGRRRLLHRARRPPGAC